MKGFLRRLFGLEDDRRRFERYEVSAPLSVTVGGRAHECAVENVSAGGVRLTPPVEAGADQTVTIVHPKSGLSLEGRVVASDQNSTRIKFESEEAGTIVSVWVRMLHEDPDAD